MAFSVRGDLHPDHALISSPVIARWKPESTVREASAKRESTVREGLGEARIDRA